VYRHTGERRFLDPALAVARCTAAKQYADGSWDYQEESEQESAARWKDNFHTGFNLLALQSIGKNVKTAEFDQCLRRGLEFYRMHFFREDGAAKYYHNHTYPIDSHCVAQSIITLVELRELDPHHIPLANSVFRWAMDHLWDERGFFYYRMLRFCTIRTSYMRWTQAWMFLALSSLHSELQAVAPVVSAASSTTSKGT
jgi:hypothetical protein